MIKSIRFKNVCEKFKKGINYTNNVDVIEACATCFGGFCNAFDKGTGRRIDLPQNETEIDISTHAIVNDRNFYFTRCYTNLRSDTESLDEKQDIVKYAKQLQKKLDDKKEAKKVNLPLFVYYNESIDFVPIEVDISDVECCTNRTVGYSNCLIVKDHFNCSQQMFAISNFLYWQKDNFNIKDQFYYNFQSLTKILNCFLNHFNFKSLRYDIIKKSLILNDSKKDIKFEDLDSDKKIMIAIILDILMRTIILNPTSKKILDTYGVVCVSYCLKQKDLDYLNNFIMKNFHNFQIICY